MRTEGVPLSQWTRRRPGRALWVSWSNDSQASSQMAMDAGIIECPDVHFPPKQDIRDELVHFRV